jgi:uncharacterized membrane protein YdjX (TVP38/TMEM64 family)
MPATDAVSSRRALAAVLLLAVGVFYALGLHRYLTWDYVRGHLDQAKSAADGYRWTALLIFFGVYVGVTALPLPAATVLSLLAGALFGLGPGVAVVSLASTLGATLAMLSSRYVLRDAVERRFGSRLAPLHQGIERDGAFYLFTLRLVPAVPFFLVNLGMGLTRLPLRTFVWVSWLGMLPGTVVYVNAGTELGRINTPSDALTPGVLIALAALGLLPLVLRLSLRLLGAIRR